MVADPSDPVYRLGAASTSSSRNMQSSFKQPNHFPMCAVQTQDPHSQDFQGYQTLPQPTPSSSNPPDLFSAFSPAYFSPAVPRRFRAIWARHGGTTLRPPLSEPDVPPAP
ncbi:hypothetical protein JCM24511_02918 [Saitozyma sp. JCM 24511]|nr:hypothetical protein JCM24511_02918 [Saitozyma sp. JCM 24511]